MTDWWVITEDLPVEYLDANDYVEEPSGPLEPFSNPQDRHSCKNKPSKLLEMGEMKLSEQPVNLPNIESSNKYAPYLDWLKIYTLNAELPNIWAIFIWSSALPTGNIGWHSLALDAAGGSSYPHIP